MAIDNLGVNLIQNNSTSLYDRSKVEAATNELTMNDFYQLLAAQLKYQDADNPMDTSQMMAQMVQTQMITALNHMTTVIDDLSLVNTTSYAASMVGKEVTVAKVDENGKYTGEEVTGTVTGVNLGTTPMVHVNGESYKLTQLMSIGTEEESSSATGTETKTEAEV